MRARLFVACVTVALSLDASAQDEAEVTPPSEVSPTQKDKPTAPNTTAGELTPAKGFNLVQTEWGSLNISFYGLARYLNHLPANQTFIDHLGRERVVKTRNDINWHRTMIWLSGFALDPRLVYVITVWSLPTTPPRSRLWPLETCSSDSPRSCGWESAWPPT
jgi:hypothetical protein